MNWADYIKFKIVNPKGIFKLIAATKLMERFYKPMLAVGSPNYYKHLISGISYFLRKQHQVSMAVFSTQFGDEYQKVAKSPIDDKYLMFIASKDPAGMQILKQKCTNQNGQLQLFLDQPII